MKAASPQSPARPGGVAAQAGSLTVEMALVLPILISLLLGIIEIANIMRIQMSLNSAVTTIAHDTAMHKTTKETAETFMNSNNLLLGVKQSDEADPPSLSLTPVETTPCKTTPCTPFEVKLTYTYKALTSLMEPFFDNIQLTASARKMSEDWGTQ
jgi:Flp pilus assembly protein TadG